MNWETLEVLYVHVDVEMHLAAQHLDRSCIARPISNLLDTAQHGKPTPNQHG